MSFLINQATMHLEQGLERQQAGDRRQARHHFLRAAEMLFRAAEQDEAAKAKRTHLEQAERLLERARSLPATLPKTKRTTTAGKKSQPLAGGDDTADKKPPWLLTQRPKTRFADVAGLDKVKEQVRLRLIYPFTNPEVAQRYRVKKGGGLLLYGPPGTGKTLLARAVAGEIDAAFFLVKGSQVMSEWVGRAEKNVNLLFQEARQYERSVIFLDELDGLVPKRRATRSSVVPRVVNEFLQQMEGVEEHGGALLFIGATNEPWALDPAILRPGRLDEKVFIPPPGPAARQRILELNLKGVPLAPDVDLAEVAEHLEGYSGADVAHVCRRVGDALFLEAVKIGQERDVAMRDLLAAAEETLSSINPKDLAKYEKFARG